MLVILVSRLVFNVVCVSGGIRVAHLSFTSCVQCRLCYWRDPCCSSQFHVLCSKSSVLLEGSMLPILVSRFVFNVVCVSAGIRVAHLRFTSCVQCRL